MYFAAKKLSTEEKQLLGLQLFASDSIGEMKDFETELKKKKPLVKRQKKKLKELQVLCKKRIMPTPKRCCIDS